MPLPFSKSQVEKLGNRLIAQVPPAQEDIDQLHELLLAYEEALQRCVSIVRERLDIEATPRLKNTGTIIEKLNRHGGSWLKSIQDLAGMRIVKDFSRADQDELANSIEQLFSAESRPPKIVDRRREPSNGYRAVHVIVFIDGLPVEIQVRTHWQHTWADLFEKMADKFGRNIRYGEPPEHWRDKVEFRKEPRSQRQLELLEELYLVSYEMRVAMVRTALALASFIDVLESAPGEELSAALGEDYETYLRQVEDGLADLREELEGQTSITDITASGADHD